MVKYFCDNCNIEITAIQHKSNVFYDGSHILHLCTVDLKNIRKNESELKKRSWEETTTRRIKNLD